MGLNAISTWRNSENRYVLRVTSLVSTLCLVASEVLDWGKTALRGTDLLSIATATDQLTHRVARVDSAHGTAFSTSIITASRSLNLLINSSRFRSSIVCISLCRSVRVRSKRCIIPVLRLFHVANSFGTQSLGPSVIKVSKDSSLIFSERQSTTSSPLERDIINVVL